MTLTSRLSLFSAAALAVVLAGFSTTLYLLSRSYLYGQIDEHMEATLDTLTAGAEVKPDGVEWEPRDRTLIHGSGSLGEPIRWVVSDNQGNPLDRSVSAPADDRVTKEVLAFSRRPDGARIESVVGQPWRLSKRRIEANLGPSSSVGKAPARTPSRNRRPRFPSIVVAVAISQEPVQSALSKLAVTLIAVSLGISLLALFGGRLLCRRALAPLTRMSAFARQINASDLAQRLPVTNTHDELDELSTAFNDLLGRLHDSFERQSRFAGDASHQLRTPLTAMLGQIDVALRRSRAPDEYERALVLAKEQGSRLRQIVEMLMFLARSDADALLPQLETIDLGQWLQRHMQTWNDHPRARDLEVHSLPGAALWVDAHPWMLGQVVDNLLENAFKYSQPSSAVVIRLSHDENVVTLSVQDEGCGIAAAEQPHIFESFYRTPQARKKGIEGIGLGLAVAKRIVDALRGEILVHSESQKGSCFVLRLPRSAKNPSALTDKNTTHEECESAVIHREHV